jgi:hypothetical protein
VWLKAGDDDGVAISGLLAGGCEAQRGTRRAAVGLAVRRLRRTHEDRASTPEVPWS